MQKLLDDRRLLLPVIFTALVIAIGSVAIVLTADGTSDDGSPSASAPSDSAQPASGGGDGVRVDIMDFKFKPPSVAVAVGGQVTFTNDDSALHTATLDGTFDTGNLKQGDAKPVTFDQAGTYDYICDIHPFMKGTVVVK